jgi:hypothetical protein
MRKNAAERLQGLQGIISGASFVLNVYYQKTSRMYRNKNPRKNQESSKCLQTKRASRRHTPEPRIGLLKSFEYEQLDTSVYMISNFSLEA